MTLEFALPLEGGRKLSWLSLLAVAEQGETGGRGAEPWLDYTNVSVGPWTFSARVKSLLENDLDLGPIRRQESRRTLSYRNEHRRCNLRMVTLLPTQKRGTMLRNCGAVKLIPLAQNGSLQLFRISFTGGGRSEQPRQHHRQRHLYPLLSGFGHRRVQNHLQSV